MYAILKRSHTIVNGSMQSNTKHPQQVGTIEFSGSSHLAKPSNHWQLLLPAGSYQVERVPNPYGHEAPWLVLCGTLIGMAEGAWRQWEGVEWEEWEIVIK